MIRHSHNIVRRVGRTALNQRTPFFSANRNCRLRVSSFSTSSASTSASTSSTKATRSAVSGTKEFKSSADEIATLRDEIQTLQMLLKQQNSQYQGISKQIKEQSDHLERAVKEIQNRVSLMSAPLDVIATAVKTIQTNPSVNNILSRLEGVSRGWVNGYTLAGFLLTLLFIRRYRANMLERTSEEVAELASRTLQQERLRQTIQETLDLIANSPETMKTLQDLLRKVLNDPATVREVLKLVSSALESPEVLRSALALVSSILADEATQQEVAEFALKGLDLPPTKAMLEQQTQALVRETVRDTSVQQATAVGVRKSLWYAFIPSFMWPSTTAAEGAAAAAAVEDAQ
mmetsp:Transcript_25427/g.36190  ORF Transcript_25427/g.36190 Transcript_25427/m.36190 type:complete len:346 (-) Transcript_25427:280-1317(-)